MNPHHASRARIFIASLVLLMAPAPLFAQEEADAGIVGGRSNYVVKAGDTITAIAARFAVRPDAVIKANGLVPSAKLSVGQVLQIDNSHIATGAPGVTITINVPQRLLVVREGDNLTGYPITVGSRNWRTPLGDFTIVEKETDPAWDVPISIQREMERQGKPVITRMEPSPDNPLGAYWLRLSFPGIGIHGTNAPASIYRFASHGCIRMHPDDIAKLFQRVAVGTTGAIVYRPIIMAVIEDRIWLEATGDEYGLAPDRFQYVRALVEHHGLTDSIDWSAVDRVLTALAGHAEDVTKQK